MQATRKASKRVSTLAQPPSKEDPMNTLFLMVFILYPFILEFFNPPKQKSQTSLVFGMNATNL